MSSLRLLLPNFGKPSVIFWYGFNLTIIGSRAPNSAVAQSSKQGVFIDKGSLRCTNQQSRNVIKA
jgi:hypothetical protein